MVPWLYKEEKISKETFKTASIALIFFLVGVVIHVLIVNVLIIEIGYWV